MDPLVRAGELKRNARLPGLWRLVVQAERVGFVGQIVECLAAVLTALVAVGEEIVETDASRLLAGDLAVFQQLDKSGPADAEQVGGLLGGQALSQRRHRDRSFGAHSGDHLGQHLVHRRWQVRSPASSFPHAAGEQCIATAVNFVAL